MYMYSMYVYMYMCTFCMYTCIYVLTPNHPPPLPHSYTGYHIKLKGAPGSRERSDEEVYGGAHGHRAGPHGPQTSATDAGRLPSSQHKFAPSESLPTTWLFFTVKVSKTTLNALLQLMEIFQKKSYILHKNPICDSNFFTICRICCVRVLYDEILLCQHFVVVFWYIYSCSHLLFCFSV